MRLTDASLEELSRGVRGEVIRPGDPRYDEGRKVWNAMIDRRPRLIVRCLSTEDVVRAVNFATDHGVPLSVRGGGHSASPGISGSGWGCRAGRAWFPWPSTPP